MLGGRATIVIGSAVLLTGTLTGMALDPNGYRLWKQLGGDVARLDASNAELSARIATLERKADALRSDAHVLDQAAHETGDQRAETLREDSHAFERAAHESGYIHSDETLFQLK